MQIPCRTLVHILTRVAILAQPMPGRTRARKTAQRILATVHASVLAAATLVHILTVEMIEQPIAAPATALVRSIQIATFVCATMLYVHTLVDVLAMPAVRRQPIARLAGARMRPEQIHANITAMPIVLDTLVRVHACPAIASQLIARLALAHMRTEQIATAHLAATVRHRALINIGACPRVRLQLESTRTRAQRSARSKRARMRAPAISHIAFVLLGARFTILEQSQPGGTRTMPRSGHIMTRMRAVPVARLDAFIDIRARALRFRVQTIARRAAAPMRTGLIDAQMRAAAIVAGRLTFVNVQTFVGPLC